MTENPLADAVSKFLTTGGIEAPCFKVIASAHCEPDKMLIMNPEGLGIVDPLTEARHPGLKIIVCPTDAAAEQVTVWARDLGLDLIDDA